MEDSSLDDFLGGGTEGDIDAEDPGSEAEGVEEDVGLDEDDEELDMDDEEEDDEEEENDEISTTDTDVESATATMVFAPEGAACDGCGEVVTRRWRAEGGLHCLDCKEW